MLSPVKFKRDTKNGKTKTIHVKLIKFNFLDIPSKHWLDLNTNNVFTNPAFMVLKASEESVDFYLIWFHSSYYVISLKFRRIFQKVEESCFRTSKELFSFTLSFAHWVLCRYRIIIILVYLSQTKKKMKLALSRERKSLIFLMMMSWMMLEN